MKEIQLIQGQYALVDDEDFDYLNQWKWTAQKYINKYKTDYRAMRSQHIDNINGKRIRKTIKLHRVIMEMDLLRNHNEMKYYEFYTSPRELQVDHIDGNPLNNQKSNLRIVSPRENIQNRHDITSSKYPGVSFRADQNKWRVWVSVKDKKYNVGQYQTEEEAYEAYLEAVDKINAHKKML